MKRKKTVVETDADVILIGAGIMSATLGLLLKTLEPSLTIEVYERLDIAAAESSDAWNNAGTGHSAFCELNYTPQKADGSVDIRKAVQIAESFEVSKQFWAYFVECGVLPEPSTFINNIPHFSFVWGKKNVEFLKTRYTSLSECNLFNKMEYSEDAGVITKWIPLVMEGRSDNEDIAATKMDMGTDVNFGSLTRKIFTFLAKQNHVNLYFNHEVKDLDKAGDRWKLGVSNLENDKKRNRLTKFLFIGAGGGSLPLLKKSNIKESIGYGGFPVSGQWLKCVNQKVIARHQAKVYGKAAVGAPPMSVPHLDTRMINGKKALLFGPYAGFSTKFLKHGSFLDLPLSIKFNNIRPMISAGLKNIDLTKYLIEQVRQSPQDRFAALKEYLPEAKFDDWELEIAGQRVQVIKKKANGGGGVLEFGTEVVSADDGSIAALLGASPGASTAVSIMLDLIGRCFKKQMKTTQWQQKIKEIIPSYGQKLSNNNELCEKTRAYTAQTLKLKV